MIDGRSSVVGCNPGVGCGTAGNLGEEGVTTASKSVMRWDMRRTSAPWGVGSDSWLSRSENPISSWSGAMRRHTRPPDRAMSTVACARCRHRYDQVGLPCRARIVPLGSSPSPRSTSRVSRTWKECGLSGVLASTIRDQAGSHSGSFGESEPAVQEISLNLYHSISVIAVLSPDPTPMHRMRSPGLRCDASRLSVIGREAGPTLPSSG